MIKLVVCDLDGTLLPYGQERINDKTFEKINALLNKGISFAVSSGRVYSELAEFLKPVMDDIFVISSDGALASYKDKIIFNKPFSSDALNFAVDCRNDALVRFFGKDKVWSVGDTKNEYPTDVKVLKPFEIKEPIYKIVSNSQILNFDKIHSRIHYSDGSVSEYVPPYANKGVTLGALQRHLGVSLYDTLAMGDSVNDIPMMKNARYSVAVGKSSELLRSHCKIFTDKAETILEKVWLNADFDM